MNRKTEVDGEYEILTNNSILDKQKTYIDLLVTSLFDDKAPLPKYEIKSATVTPSKQ